jgi:hypothetical protein
MTTNSDRDPVMTEFVINAYELYAGETDDAEKAKDYRARAAALRAQAAHG